MRVGRGAAQLTQLWQATDLAGAARRQPWLAAVAMLSLALTTALTALVHAGVTGVSAALQRELAQDAGLVLHLEAAAVSTSCPLAARRCPAAGAAEAWRSVRTLHEVAATLPAATRALVVEGMATLHHPLRRRRVRVLGAGGTLFRLQSTHVERGRLWSAYEERSGRRVAVVGQALVDSQFAGRPPRRVRLGAVTVDIVGVVRSGPVAPIDLDQTIVLSPTTFRAVSGSTVGAFRVVARGDDGAPQAALHRLRRQSPRHFASISVSSTSERLGDVDQLEGALRHGARGLSLVLAVASVVAVAALSASIARAHRREVGILRAMGATRRLVLLQGALIGAMLGVCGAVAGALLAVPAMQLWPRWLDMAALPTHAVLSSLLRGAAPAVSVAVIVCTALFARLARRPPAALL